jgi:23S rRNA (cytosine1962-C5)-methyltransferase
MTTISSSYPTVRLKPKANARALRHGFPWVYANELVTDRRTKAISPGTIVCLEDADRRPLGLFAFNAKSKIMCRFLDTDIDALIDTTWLSDRLHRALSLRSTLFDHPYYRWVHAEADGLPGVIIDRFDETLVVQPNAAWAEVLFPQLLEALTSFPGISTVVKNGTGRARVLEGLEDTTDVVVGSVSAPVSVPMNGAVYKADVTGGQKTGLFYDQRPNHAFLQSTSKDARVLDVFSHVGGFGLAALAGGATSALSVDGSEAALTLAEAGAKDMGVSERFATRKGDAFDVMSALADAGERFDVVICDPPAFAPSKSALEAGLRAYERVARLGARLVADGGYLVLCSCSHAADLGRFRGASTRGIGRAGRKGQLIHTGFAGPDHPQLPQLAESGYLKALFYRL